jgi:peroxiredoxin
MNFVGRMLARAARTYVRCIGIALDGKRFHDFSDFVPVSEIDSPKLDDPSCTATFCRAIRRARSRSAHPPIREVPVLFHSSIPSRAALRALTLFFVMNAGCSKQSAEASRPASAAPALTSGTAPSAAPTPASSNMKQYASPSADRLGRLAPGTGIVVGEVAPNVSALDLDGRQVSLADLYKSGPILLAFYRGGWCPYCNTEIHSLTQAYPEYRKRGVTPVALSVEKPEQSSKLKATYTIPFPVLSDTEAKSLEAFHLIKKVPEEELAKMKSFGIDLEALSGKTHHEIAIPALFLIDRTGIVRFAHSDPDFKVRPSTAQLLAAIDALKLED